MRRLVVVLVLSACGADPGGATLSPAPDGGGKADSTGQGAGADGGGGGPFADGGAAFTELKLEPSGRMALATGEELPLRVVAVDGAGTQRDVTAAARFTVRNGTAGQIRESSFIAANVGSQSTTVVASWGTLDSAPLLISTLAPAWSEGFEAAREVRVAGPGSGARTSVEPLSGGASLSIAVSGRAGEHVRVTLPLAAPLSVTNAERALLAYRVTGDLDLEARFGTMNGDSWIDAVGSESLNLHPGTEKHASIPLNGAFFDSSWDARAVVVDLTLVHDATGEIVLDDLRILRQFIVGANLAWLDGAFGHDFGHDFHHPTWGVAYDPAHMEEILGFCQEQGVRLLRVWVFEGCEGLIKDADEIVTGVDDTLWESFDDLVFRQLPKYDVKVYFTLLGAAHFGECSSPSPLPAGRAREALLANAVEPFARRYGGSPWVWGFDLMNEPEGAVAGPTGNWSTGVSWDTMRDFLAEGAGRVRAAAPRALVSSGSGWHGPNNVRDGRFSGLGFTHLDFHQYADDGALPDYPDLQRHARVLIGEAGQQTERFDDALQKDALSKILAGAATQSYWGVLSWYVDHPGSTDHLTLLAPGSTYGALRPRPAALLLRDLSRTRGDIGP